MNRSPQTSAARLLLLCVLIVITTNVAACDSVSQPSPQAPPTSTASEAAHTQRATSTIPDAATTHIPLVATLTAIAHMPTTTPVPLVGKVDVGGYRLYYRCFGDGAPTVILDTGSGGDSTNWLDLPIRVRDFTRVCIYDRAGLGESDPGPKPTTSAQMVRDLHALLVNAGVPGPYVLVGWSIGGMNMRLYAYEYPEDVVGVILLDSAHPDEFQRILALLPPEMPNDPPSLKEVREFAQAPFSMGPEVYPESLDWQTSVEQVRSASSLGDAPLVVITASPDLRYDLYPDDFPQDVARRLNDDWQTLQKDLLLLSTNSRQIIAERSGHCIHCTEINLVKDAIKNMVNGVRSP